MPTSIIKTRFFTIYPCCGCETWFDIWFDEIVQKVTRKCKGCETTYTVTIHNSKNDEGLTTHSRLTWEAEQWRLMT